MALLDTYEGRLLWDQVMATHRHAYRLILEYETDVALCDFLRLTPLIEKQCGLFFGESVTQIWRTAKNAIDAGMTAEHAFPHVGDLVAKGLLKIEGKEPTSTKDYETVLRIHRVEQSPEALADSLTKLEHLEFATQNFVRAAKRAGVDDQ